MKLSIRAKVLLSMVVGVLATIFTIGYVLIYAFYTMHDVVTKKENDVNNRLSESMGSYVEEQVKLRLKEVAEAKAQHLNRELVIVGEDVEFMADSLSQILTSSQYYNPRQLPNTYQAGNISPGVPYIHYSPSLRNQGISENLRQEISLAANFAGTLKAIGSSYVGYHTHFYAGSKNGYLIAMDLNSAEENNDSIFLSEQERETFIKEYDPRERQWYKLGQDATKPTFSIVYNSNEKYMNFICVMPYFDSEGFAGVIGISYGIDDLYKTSVNSTLNNERINFIIEDTGDVAFSSETEGILAATPDFVDLRQSSNVEIAEAARRMTAGESGVMNLQFNGKNYYIAFAPLKNIGWSYGTLINCEEIISSVEKVKSHINNDMEELELNLQEVFIGTMLHSTIFLIPILILLFFGSLYMSSKLTRPISRLSEEVKEIANGNFDKKIEMKTGDEIEHLANCFNVMTDELKEYTQNLTKAAAKEERARTELEVAAKIQADMLPYVFPNRKEIDIYATMNAAKTVGGDFYDFYMFDENHLVITIADVSGKGVPAALFMAMSKTVIKNCVMTLKDPNKLSTALENANNRLCQNNEAAMFVTVFLGILNLQTGEFVYSDAGHCPPLCKRGRKYDFLKMKKGSMLGLIEQKFEQQSIELSPNDTIFLYTDGISETMNEEGKQFTEPRIKFTLNTMPAKLNAEKILSEMLKSVKIFAGNAEQSDDITILALRYNGYTEIES